MKQSKTTKKNREHKKATEPLFAHQEGEETDSATTEENTPEMTVIARTHRAFGLFPNALLLSGYGESEVEKERSFTIMEKNPLTGIQIERRFEMFTKSELGLPRGRDPHVLVSLLKLLFSKDETTNSVWFRKAELLKLLGWTDNAENRADLDGAIVRYFDTAYRGMSLETDAKKVRERERVRRLITGYDRVDERRVRHAADKTADAQESGRMFTRVIFDPDFINDLRGDRLSLATDIKFLRALDSSSLASRLYEVLNYVANEGQLEFRLEIKELAHERLGISRKTAAPSQCWQKISHAFAKLQAANYLIAYEYERATGHISGLINPKFAPPQPPPLPPLPTASDPRTSLKKRFVALGTYPNAAASALKKLPDELLLGAELIVARIEQVRRDNLAQGKDFKWGGWAYNELTELLEQGYINPNLLEEESPDEPPEGKDVKLADAEPPTRVAADPHAAALWARIVAKLNKRINATALATWFGESAITPLKLEGQTLTVSASSLFVKDWVTGNFAADLRAAATEVSRQGKPLEIVWSISEEGNR